MKNKNKIASLFTPLHTGRGWGWVLLLLLIGCGDHDEATTTVVAEPDVPIVFTPYVNQTTETRAGSPGVMDLTKLQTTGFGVFAYHTADDDFTNHRFSEFDGVGTHPALSARKPDFMYNELVTWNGTAWTYSPLKYWPNGQTSANVSGVASGSGGMVSFFFYAPYTARPTYTDTNSDGVVNEVDALASSNDGILYFDGKDNLTTPYLYYRCSTNPENVVDLMWGVASNDINYNIWPVNTPMSGLSPATNVAAGMPLVDLQRPYNKSQALPVTFRHATTRLDFVIQGAFDELSPGETNVHDDTRVLVKELNVTTNTPNQGRLNLLNSVAGTPAWELAGTPSAMNLALSWDDGLMNARIRDVENIRTYLATASNFDLLPEGVTNIERSIFISDDSRYYLIPINKDTPANPFREISANVEYDIITRDPSLVLNNPAGFSIVNNNISKTITLTDPAKFEAGKHYKVKMILGFTTVKFEVSVLDDSGEWILLSAVVKDWDTETKEVEVE